MTLRIEPFFCTTQRIELFSVWLKELSPFVFQQYDSKNWTLFIYVTMNWTLFLTNQRIEPCFLIYDSKTWALFQKYDFQELNFLKNVTQGLNFLKYDSKNWTFFFWIWLTETLRIDLFSSNMTHKTHRVEHFYKWLEDLNFLLEICFKELYLFE